MLFVTLKMYPLRYEYKAAKGHNSKTLNSTLCAFSVPVKKSLVKYTVKIMLRCKMSQVN